MNKRGSIELLENRSMSTMSVDTVEPATGGQRLPLVRTQDNHRLQPENRHQKSLLRKHFRPGELIAEAFIKSVSFISFAVIVLIFIFVFREATPIFFPGERTALSTETQEQETYGDAPASPGAKTVPAQKPLASLKTSGGEGEAAANDLLGT